MRKNEIHVSNYQYIFEQKRYTQIDVSCTHFIFIDRARCFSALQCYKCKTKMLRVNLLSTTQDLIVISYFIGTTLFLPHHIQCFYFFLQFQFQSYNPVFLTGLIIACPKYFETYYFICLYVFQSVIFVASLVIFT